LAGKGSIYLASLEVDDFTHAVKRNGSDGRCLLENGARKKCNKKGGLYKIDTAQWVIVETNKGDRIMQTHLRNYWEYRRDMLVSEDLENNVEVICVIVVRKALSASR
jgi:hypothetical protein